MSHKQERRQLQFADNTGLEVWRCSHGGDTPVIRKEVVTPMPPFLPDPPHPDASPSSSDSSGKSRPKALPQPYVLGCREPHLSCTEPHLADGLALAWVQRPKGLRQTSQGLELSSQILRQPWQASASSSGHDSSRALCHHTLGASPAKRGKDQARAGAQAGKQLLLGFACSWRRIRCYSSQQGQQE